MEPTNELDTNLKQVIALAEELHRKAHEIPTAVDTTLEELRGKVKKLEKDIETAQDNLEKAKSASAESGILAGQSAVLDILRDILDYYGDADLRKALVEFIVQANDQKLDPSKTWTWIALLPELAQQRTVAPLPQPPPR